MMLIRLRARDVIVMLACSSIIVLFHFLFRELPNVYECKLHEDIESLKDFEYRSVSWFQRVSPNL